MRAKTETILHKLETKPPSVFFWQRVELADPTTKGLVKRVPILVWCEIKIFLGNFRPTRVSRSCKRDRALQRWILTRPPQRLPHPLLLADGLGWSIVGSLPSARATRTFSRAVAGSQPTRHASQ